MQRFVERRGRQETIGNPVEFRRIGSLKPLLDSSRQGPELPRQQTEHDFDSAFSSAFSQAFDSTLFYQLLSTCHESLVSSLA